MDFEVDRPPPAGFPPGDLLITIVKETIILYKKRVLKYEKKSETCSHLSLIWKWWKREDDCEIACDCVKRANMVLGLCICIRKEIFASKHTVTHQPTSAQPLIVTTMTHTHTHTHTHTYTWEDRHSREAPQASSLADVGTKTTFRLDQRNISKKVTISWGQRSVDAIKPQQFSWHPFVCGVCHWEAQWPIGYGVGLRIKRSSVRIRPWPPRWVLGQGSLLPLFQGEAFTLASISYLAILVNYILAKKNLEFYEWKFSRRSWMGAFLTLYAHAFRIVT